MIRFFKQIRFRDRLNMLGSWISLSGVGREFHSFEAAIANARFWIVLVKESGCVKIGWFADRRSRFGLCSTSSLDKYSGAFPCAARNVTSNILYETLCCMVVSEPASVYQRCVYGVGCMQLLLQSHFGLEITRDWTMWRVAISVRCDLTLQMFLSQK